MKTWVKVVIGIAVVVVVAFAGVYYLTSGVVRASDDFFAALSSGEAEEAYGRLSEAFRANTTEDELAAYLSANRMDKVSDTSWGSRSVTTSRGNLAGTLTTVDGESIPVEIDLIKEEGEWKIYALRITAEPAGIRYGPKGLPDEKEQLALIAESTSAFADAVAAEDMSGFREHIAHIWARQFDTAKLDESYRPVYPASSSLQSVKTLAPVYEHPAKLTDTGVMKLQFYYPADTTRIHFTLEYIYEGTRWRLIGLNVQTKNV